MKIAHGVDILLRSRFVRSWNRNPESLSSRLFHASECALYGNDPLRLASCFAAKEAVAKAFGLGLWGKGFSFLDIEIYKEEGQPCFRLLPEGEAKIQGKILSSSLSISHDGDYVMASVCVLLEEA